MPLNNKRISYTLMILILLAASFWVTYLPVWDPDSFWHLAFGKCIFTVGSLPHTEPFSFSREGASTVDISWLPHLLFYLVFKYSGFSGLQLLTSLLAAAVTTVLILLAKRENSPILSLVL